MNLIIEHRRSLSSAVRFKNHSPMVDGSIVRLDFVLETQLLNKWCWAAIATSIARYYRTGDWQQTELASILLDRDCSDLSEACNRELMLKEALDFTSNYSHWSPGRPAFERIQDEINNGRPLCPRIEWSTGGAHYLVVVGYNHDLESLIILDSLEGERHMAYKEFPLSYGTNGGAWTETFWTNKTN